MSKYLAWLTIGPRGVGRTAALVEAAKKIGGTFVCFNSEQARQLARQGVPTISVDSDPRGTRGPYIFDHMTMAHIASEYEGRIQELETKLDARTKALEDVRHTLDDYLGDTDPPLADDMTDEDIRAEEPIFWCHKRIAGALRDE